MTAEPALELPSALKRAIVVGVVVATLVGAVGTALLPYLLVNHPVLLVVTSADARNLVLVAPQLGLPMLLLVAVPRRALAMALTYGLARIYGRSAIAWSVGKFPRLARVFAGFEKLFVRFRRTALVLWPTYMSAALGGATQTSLRAFLPWMVLGQVGYVLVAFYVGDAISGWTDGLIEFFRRNLWQATAVCVGLVSLQQLVSYIRRRRAAERVQAAGG